MSMYILKNANIINMENGNVLSSTDIIINNGTIVEIGTEIKACDAKETDCSGKYVIPGLFDMHAHIAIEDVLPLFILNGVTSVRNMWGSKKHLKLAEKVNSGEKIGPEIFSASPLYDGKDKLKDGRRLILSLEDAKKAIDDTIDNGYYFLKTYPNIKKEVFLKLSDLAKDKGIKIIGHGNLNVNVNELIKSGYYSLEHLHCLPNDKNNIEYLAKGGIWFCPTYVVEEMTEEYVFGGKDYTKCEGAELVSNMTLHGWKRQVQVLHKNFSRPGRTTYGLDSLVEKGKHFMKFSDKILAGTDTPLTALVAGVSLQNEIISFVKVFGMKPFEALKTATINPALHLGIENEKGMIKEGYDSDLVILRDNPLEDITNIKKVDTVIQGKNYFDKESLKRIRNQIINNKEKMYEMYMNV